MQSKSIPQKKKMFELVGECQKKKRTSNSDDVIFSVALITAAAVAIAAEDAATVCSFGKIEIFECK